MAEGEVAMAETRGTAWRTNAFERAVAPRSRPGFVVEPEAVAWHTVAFRVRAERTDRTAVAAVPRQRLDAFIDELEAGRLDRAIMRYLSDPPSGRVLASADQADAPALFDELAAPDAITPDERTPGRPSRFGRGGGASTGPRRDKRARRPRGPRLVVGAVIAAGVLAVGAVALAARSSDTPSRPAAAAPVSTTTAPLAVTSTAPLGAGFAVDFVSGGVRALGTICPAGGHVDLNGQIESGGVVAIVTGPIDIVLQPDGTGTFTGHTDVVLQGQPGSFSGDFAGHLKLNRLDPAHAELEILDNTVNGSASAGGLTLPVSASDATHLAIPLTPGATC